MQSLRPFDSEISTIPLSADLIRSGESLLLQFEINDLQCCLNLPEAFNQSGDLVPRADSLWNNTCFEMFLKPFGGEDYYEFNFSLSPEWNLYKFSSYRLPQPPTTNADFKLKHLQWTGHKLIIELTAPKLSPQFAVGLTAILKETSQVKHYLALTHAGEKPDFHLAKSFILKR